MRKIALLAVAGALVLPSSALASDTADAPSPAQSCKDQRTAIGVSAFAQKYGTNKNKTNAFGKCVSQTAKADAEEAIAEHNEATIDAAKACKAERAADPDAFAQKYGTNANKRNAYGKCVSKQAQPETS